MVEILSYRWISRLHHSMVEYGNILWQGRQSAEDWFFKIIEPRWYKFPTSIGRDPNSVFKELKTKYPHLYDGTIARYTKLEDSHFFIQFIKYSEVLTMLQSKLSSRAQVLGFKLIVRHRDQILLGRRTSKTPHYPGYWSTPGGLIEYTDANNPLNDACLRELEEETGIEVDITFDVILVAESQDTGNINIVASLTLDEIPQLEPNDEWMGLGFYSKGSIQSKDNEMMTEELNWLIQSGLWNSGTAGF